MSGIKKRTVFVDVHEKSVYDSGDAMTRLEKFHKIWDWALVTTEIGSMAEPFQMGQKYPICTNLGQEYNPEDEMSRVDEIRIAEPDWKMLSGGSDNPPLIGGYGMTRVGR